ncbi:kelch-like protein 20 [Anastrepha ludens]|uniref:kelch-like protein 20 n=1 Tax=Anastrepha ludens TaxID=28586 RepID=UPI0023B1D300|nr:kelch-like protein 20 [Anastrepha ludens]
MGSSCSRNKEIPTVNESSGNGNVKRTYNDSNSCLLAVQFDNENSIRVLKYNSTKEDWTICHEIPVKGLYRTSIVKQYLLFHDWHDGLRICCYDTTTRAIRTLKPLKIEQPQWRCYCAVEFQERLYLIGADSDDNRKVYIWDPENDHLSAAPKLIVGRTRATALKHEGYLYLAGGMVTNLGYDHDSNAVERYNPRRRCWEQCASLQQARGVPGMASAGVYIYAIGGDCNDIPTNMVERYDTRINKWTQIIAMQVPKVFAACVYYNNRLLVCGNTTNKQNCSYVEEFDEATKKWCRKNDMPLEGPFSYVLATPAWTMQLESLN